MAMRQLKGVTMYRVVGLIVTAVLISTNRGVPNTSGAARSVMGDESGAYYGDVDRRPPIDVSALLTAARGAPPIICSLAAQSVRGFGWGDWSDAPSTPLASVVTGDRI